MRRYLSSISLVLISSGLSPFMSKAFAKEHVITQKGKLFSTEEITIAPGDTVVFKNDDDTSHNVFSASEGQKFNLGIQKAATQNSHKFASAGTAEVRCAIHPKMKLKVNIK